VLIRISENNIDAASIDTVVKSLRDGGIIIYPTDTVYALGCDITKQRAVERISKLRHIDPARANFSFVCADLSHLSEFTKPIPNQVYRVMKKALPGPYTFILEANNNVPRLLKQNKKTVGIRVPDNNICRAIVRALGNPIMSASLHDESDGIVEYYSDPETIFEQFQDVVDIVVDGGYGNVFPSTVLDCSGDDILVIREGLGSLEVL
jgi:tRNA threonylcarbamoyl adenosine modification protein (Sua5/YciO/YrdC/YwlC family)